MTAEAPLEAERDGEDALAAHDVEPGWDRSIPRGAELSVIGDTLARIHGGGRALLIRGDPGIGKTWLLDRSADLAAAAHLVVLRIAGREGSSPPAFAGLSDLLAPMMSQVDQLPPVQAQALRTALGSSGGTPPELFLVALATLTLLADGAATRPVVLIVDDLHWLDGQTVDVLSFLARRLGDDPVVLVAAARPGHPAALSFGDADELVLTGLDRTSALQLLHARGELSAPDRAAILEVADGNPLALNELPVGGTVRHLPAAPLGHRLQRAFGDSVRTLPAVTRSAVLVAAVSRGEQLGPVLAAGSVLVGRPLTASVFEPAEAAGVVFMDDGRLRFRHPLIRSAVLLHEPVARQQAAHAALATVFEREPARAIWHRAAAVDGPDDAVADDLEREHLRSVDRGDLSAAISALERAAELASDPARRAQRLLLAAHHAYGLGRADLVNRLVTAALASGVSGRDQARVHWLREIFDDGDPADADRVLTLCSTAREAHAAGDGELALNLVLGAAGRCWWADTGSRARTAVLVTADALAGLQDDPRCIAAVAVAAPVLRGNDVLRRLSRHGAETVPDADRLRLLGMAARAVGDDARAADFLDRAETALRAQGRLGHLSHVLALQAFVQVELGDWQRALGSADEAFRLGSETGQPVWASGVGLLQARLSGLRGDVSMAMDGAAAVEVSPQLSGLHQFLASVQLARGIASISAGRYAEAVATLLPLFDPADPHHHPREQLSGIMYLAEAALRCGRLAAAREVLAQMESVAAVTSSPVLANQLLYARAVLADDGAAESLYSTALAHDLSRWPWIRARLQLAYGGWLRRQRRDAEAREPLRLALATLSFIGATTWAAQAYAELRSAGERFEQSGPPVATVLSPQELQVARWAAAGLSNREIGARLFLSPRTVASHLYRIFPRLGIRSRSQLGLLFGAEPVPGPAAGGGGTVPSRT